MRPCHGRVAYLTRGTAKCSLWGWEIYHCTRMNSSCKLCRMTPVEEWRPLGDSNPCYRRERAVS